MEFDFSVRCDMIERVDLDGFKKFFQERENMVWANMDPSLGLAKVKSDFIHIMIGLQSP